MLTFVFVFDQHMERRRKERGTHIEGKEGDQRRHSQSKSPKTNKK